MPNRFTIHFRYKENNHSLGIEKGTIHVNNTQFTVYQVQRNNTYLFSICPVINEQLKISWELIEKDRTEYVPKDFIPILGNWINQFYLTKLQNKDSY